MTTDDDFLLLPVQRSLSELRMRTPVESIIRNGRARQRRRRLAVGTATAAAGVTAVLVGTSVVGTNGGPPESHATPPVSPTRSQLVAFTVTRGDGGATQLSLRKGANLDPDALRQALAQHGIPALVTVGKFCNTPSHQVDTGQIFLPQEHADGNTGLTIDPAAIPAGTELSIGYLPQAIRFLLIDEHAPLVCGTYSSQPANHQSGGSKVVRSLGHH